jgi:2-methylisoborneol synthase
VSLLSRAVAPVAAHELAGLVTALLTSSARPGPRELPGSAGYAPGRRVSVPAVPGRVSGARRPGLGSAGPGTAAARLPSPSAPAATVAPAGGRGRTLPSVPTGPTGLGTCALRPGASRAAADRPGGSASAERPAAGRSSVPELYCPPALRDDPALAEEVNERLVAWAARVGIYPGQLDRVRAANFGRLLMLTHPDTDDPDRLLAAGKCGLAEWSVDDHYCDDASAGAVPELLGSRLGIAYAAVDPAHLPLRYAPELERAMREDPVLVALRSAFEHLVRYAGWAQVGRLRHEIANLFLAFDQEASWRNAGHMPAVWEYLAHRQINSFLPMITLVDAVGGYEIPAAEYADPRVRRAVTMAATAATLVNDLYSMAKEDQGPGVEFNLPAVVAAEEKCSPAEAIERSAALHDELVHTFEAEAAALALAGSPALRRFLAGVWAWLGGNREWHSTTGRYQA